jgi:iron complex outermembrane recepter protein
MRRHFKKIKKMIRKIIFSMMLLVATNTLFAQNQLKGKVTDAATGKGLEGATVNMGKATITTDNDGAFAIDCNKTSSITVSFVGYETQKKAIKNCDETIAISLAALSKSLDEVEITATSNQNKSLLHQPVSITKLSTVELKRGLGLFLDDAIQTNVPGVIMNRRSVGGGQQFNIRGYGNGTRGTRGPSSNFDGQGYKLYLNGIPVTDAEGITVFDDIDFASIGNIEVTKGPAGTLYGLAIAGAVNLSTTKAETGKTSISQELMLGSYGLVRSTTSLLIGKEKSSVMINYGHQKTDGYSWHNSSKKDFVNFIGDFTPNTKQAITVYAGYSNSYDERIGELTLSQYQNNDYSGNVEYIRRDAHSAVRTFRLGVGHTYNFTNSISNTSTIFGTGFQSDVSSAGQWADKNSINYGFRSVFNTKFNLDNNITLSGITGIEVQTQDAQVIGYSMKGSPFDTASNPAAAYITIADYRNGLHPYWVINAATSNLFYTSKTASLFTQWTLALDKGFSFTAGIGSSTMKLDLSDRFNSPLTTRPNRYIKNYNDMISPNISVNKVINKNVSVYASFSKAYKAPVSSYFYITTPAVTSPATPATGRVNETLIPEVANQFEIGSKGKLFDNRLTYEMAFFSTKYTNKMTSVSVVSPASPTTTYYSYIVNSGEQLHQGLEAVVRYEAIKKDNKGFFTSVKPFANITYSNFKYVTFTYDSSVTKQVSFKDNEVAGVPKVMANLGIDVNTKVGVYANVTYNYKDKFAVTALNDIYTDSYNLLNAKIGYKGSLSKHFDLDIYAGGQNLTGTKYFLMVFVNQLPDAYIPAPLKANMFAGINLKYNF